MNGRRIVHSVVISLLLMMLSGCTTIYSAAVDQRNIKTIAADTKIKVAIEKSFFDDKSIKVLDISAFVYDGHAYLTGEYDTSSQKKRAIAIANGTEGVKDVTTYLLAKKSGDFCGMTDNATLATKVKTALIKDKEIWATNINVEAVQCHVVLLGIVGTQAEISKAIAHAKGVENVRGVKSYLRLAR
ncbi:MAG: BON domain-containing protein [Desulfobulbaceae bacterium]|nr:BON domain-containing protein [Desulfobulbaceae bacterium]